MPEQVNLIARIEYLVRRRFPNVGLLRKFPTSLRSGRVSAPPDTTELRKAVEAYRSELLRLTLDELVARQGEEQAKEREEYQQRLDREERERFFNLPHAKADYDHWSKAAHWTLDEAIALSFGRAPEIVRWDKLANITSLGRHSWPNMRAAATLRCGKSVGSSFSIQCYPAFSWLGPNEPILPFRQR